MRVCACVCVIVCVCVHVCNLSVGLRPTADKGGGGGDHSWHSFNCLQYKYCMLDWSGYTIK